MVGVVGLEIDLAGLIVPVHAVVNQGALSLVRGVVDMFIRNLSVKSDPLNLRYGHSQGLK